MDSKQLSIEYNFQISIIKSLCKDGIINSEVADKCINRIKEDYLEIIKNTNGGSEL